MKTLILFLFFTLLLSSASACTDFTLQAKDGSWVNGRSLEFSMDTHSMIKINPRHQKMTSRAPDQSQGVSWVSKYGYIGINALGMNRPFDGMNEAGLSFGYLWLPEVTQYPQPTPQEMKQALDFIDFGSWVLGNFTTVAEVKEALASVRIWGHPVPLLGTPPVHAAIHDAKGNSIVVEFIGKQTKVHNNPIGVLTNAPPFDWQIANLQNYLHLDATNTAPLTLRGVRLAFPGQGNGFLGLPGDWTPPSRFVKIATYLRFVLQPSSHKEAVNLAEHLLNTVDIPLGGIWDPGKNTGDYTHWVVIKNLTQKTFYFRSYNDLCLKMIDLTQLDFDKGSNRELSIDLERGYIDLTSFFLHK